MGNTVCCQQQERKEFDHTITVIHKQESVRIPDLNPIVTAHLERERPFINQLPAKPIIKTFGNDVYEGKVDQRGRPHGFGKMYHKNGSVFIGEFYAGIADGLGHFVKADGSYYNGRLKSNMAEDDNGFYWSPQFEYQGSIKKNIIDGYGKETGENHTFSGEYLNGQKYKGVLKWREFDNEFEYEGPFNSDGNFQGSGRLWQKNKGEYVGSFVNGVKHGRGIYTFATGAKYIGEYYHGTKEGEGQLQNRDGSIVYKGSFKSGMPHGKGLGKDENGVMKERSWVSGIDTTFLED